MIAEKYHYLIAKPQTLQLTLLYLIHYYMHAANVN